MLKYPDASYYRDAFLNNWLSRWPRKTSWDEHHCVCCNTATWTPAGVHLIAHSVPIYTSILKAVRTVDMMERWAVKTKVYMNPIEHAFEWISTCRYCTTSNNKIISENNWIFNKNVSSLWPKCYSFLRIETTWRQSCTTKELTTDLSYIVKITTNFLQACGARPCMPGYILSFLSPWWNRSTSLRMEASCKQRCNVVEQTPSRLRVAAHFVCSIYQSKPDNKIYEWNKGNHRLRVNSGSQRKRNITFISFF